LLHPDRGRGCPIERKAKDGGCVTTSVFTLPLPSPISSPAKKKRVLLVDASPAKRDLRAETMRKLGIDVDCAADIIEARTWWRADLYNLVLINTESELGQRDKFCDDVRRATPPQQLAFLVGKPGYLSDSPDVEETLSGRKGSPKVSSDEAKRSRPDGTSSGLSQRWGILEASQRISAVRSQSHARSQTVREKPAPARDLETRFAKQNAAWSQVLPELQKEELLAGASLVLDSIVPDHIAPDNVMPDNDNS
jgi:hypothetical protein